MLNLVDHIGKKSGYCGKSGNVENSRNGKNYNRCGGNAGVELRCQLVDCVVENRGNG